jgi:hypothetical protein
MRMTPLLGLVVCLAGLMSPVSLQAEDDPNAAAIPMPAVRGRIEPTTPGADINSVGVVGPWLRLRPLPESKEQFGLEACGDKIYAVAGICNGITRDDFCLWLGEGPGYSD